MLLAGAARGQTTPEQAIAAGEAAADWGRGVALLDFLERCPVAAPVASQFEEIRRALSLAVVAAERDAPNARTIALSSHARAFAELHLGNREENCRNGIRQAVALMERFSVWARERSEMAR